MDFDLPVSASSVQLLIGLGVERGMSVPECLDGTGVHESVMADPLAELTPRQELAVIRNLLRCCSDEPDLGIEAGRRYHVAMHGVWGFALITSRTLREMIDVALRYVELAWVFTTVDLAVQDDTARLSVSGESIPSDVRVFMVERIMAAAKTILNDVLARDVALSGVAFRHAAPRDAVRYEQVFGLRPVFEAGGNVLSFDAALLDLELPQANELVRTGYERTCRDLLAQRRARTGIAGAVRDLLVRHPGEIPDTRTVASALQMSSRTLTRRLEGEGTSFRLLVDEVREALAEEMLLTAQMTTEQVARRLAYSDPASFVRAFKRWKGLSPQSFRSQSTPRS